MGIFALGMHRSGTALLGGILELMGFTTGTEAEMLPSAEENLKGFWERKDVVELNSTLLKLANASWSDVSTFDIDKVDLSQHENIISSQQTIITQLENRGSWFLKDPRFCFTLPFWSSLVQNPICVFIYRHPLEVAYSLQVRNNISIPYGLALWEQHIESAVSNFKDLPVCLLSYNDLCKDPIQTIATLYETLSIFLDTNKFNLPSNNEILQLFDNRLYRNRAKEEDLLLLTGKQQKIYDVLKTGRVALLKETVKEFNIYQNSAFFLGSHFENIPKIAQLYVDTGEGFSEEQSIKQVISKEQISIRFLLTDKKYSGIKALRFDPINTQAYLKINKINLIDEYGNSFEPSFDSNAEIKLDNNKLVFTHEDPNIFIHLIGAPKNITTFEVDLNLFSIGIKEVMKNISVQNNLLQSGVFQAKNQLILELKEQVDSYSLLRDNMEEQLIQVETAFQQQLLEKEQKLNQLNESYANINSLYIGLKNSWSSRLGFGFTAPFRWFYDFINQGKIGFVLKVLSTGVSKPKTAIAMFNKQSFKTLVSAFKNESIERIDHNLDKLTQKTETIIRAKEKEYTNGIINNVEVAGLTENSLFIRGWAISQNQIEKVEIKLNDLCKTAEYGRPREDVKNVYPKIPNSEYSEFYFYNSVEQPYETVTIIIEDKIGNKIEIEQELQEIKENFDFDLNEQYQIFLKNNKLSKKSILSIKVACIFFAYQPKISIIIPVYNVDPKWLDQCIQSVINQHYGNWEICLYDDASTNQATIQCLEAWNKKDKRIKVKFGTKTKHIAGASNEAIKLATGDFVGLLDHDDELVPNALYEVVKALNKNKQLDFIYSDEDKLELDGRRVEPHFKSDFSIDMLLSYNYICHFSVIKRSLGAQLGWFRKGYEGAQDYDLFLRIAAHTDKIHHIPKVLYHWRKISGSSATIHGAKNYTLPSSFKALESYLDLKGIKGRVKEGIKPDTFHIERYIEKEALVSIIIPFKDELDILKTCVNSISSKTLYKNYEIILISNNSQEKETFDYLSKFQTEKHPNIYVYQYNVPFNYSKINNWGVKQAKGKYILLLNNDTEVITKGWLQAMVQHIQREEVGAVGAKLLYHDNTIQHAGVIVKLLGLAGHSHKYFGDQDNGYFFRPHIVQNLSACTAACLLIKKDVFEKVNGLEENHLKIAFNDVDLCLKIRQANYLIVYTPYAKLYHYESKSRGADDTPEKQERCRKEILFFQKKWKTFLEKGDPYYNVNLTLAHENFKLNI